MNINNQIIEKGNYVKFEEKITEETTLLSFFSLYKNNNEKLVIETNEKNRNFTKEKLFSVDKITNKKIVDNSRQTMNDNEIGEIINNKEEVVTSSISKILENSSIKNNVVKTIETTKPSKGELEVFSDILEVLPQHLEECLKGGHVHIEDGGHFYNKWSKYSDAYSRHSSHPHIENTAMYGIPGPWGHEILFGIIKDEKNKKIKTWFQFENTTAKGIVNTIFHLGDYISYKVTNKNVGPYGYSKHLDSNPIQVPYKKE